MDFQSIKTNDPKEHAQNIEKYITQFKNFCHEESSLVNEPKAKALFETTSEVLGGLEKAFSDYQSENEGAWINDEERSTLQ
ncbi:MAG: hypothetical protein PHY93_09320 [Bacteriovorax sp.]|nr:hypothetical protein [Bacteriovorax sp.]